MPHLTASTIILLVIAALLLFGPNKLPELGRAFGKTLREFKNGAKEMMTDDETANPPRKEIPAEEVKIHEVKAEASQSGSNPQNLSETKPEDRRRLPD